MANFKLQLSLDLRLIWLKTGCFTNSRRDTEKALVSNVSLFGGIEFFSIKSIKCFFFYYLSKTFFNFCCTHSK